MASTIDTSGIDATKPESVSATTASVRDNFSEIITQLGNAKTDIEALQDDKQPLDADLTAIATLANTDGNFIVGNGTTWVAESGATVRTSLGLVIGTDVQAYNAGLADIAGLAKTDSNIIVGNGTNWVAESGATARTSLGLGTGNSPTFTKVTTTAASDFSAAGAYFGGTAAANLLDYHEKGTFTVTLIAATDFDSVTYNAVTGGRYERTGDACHIQGRLVTDAITVGSATGAVRLGGIPFAAAGSSGGGKEDGTAAIAIGPVFGWGGDMPCEGYVLQGASRIDLFYRTAVNGASSALQVSDVATGANANSAYFGGSYIVA